MSTAMTDQSLMPFGRHKHQRMEDVPACYLLWLWDDGWWQRTSEPLHLYIKQSFAALLKDCPDYIPHHKP